LFPLVSLVFPLPLVCPAPAAGKLAEPTLCIPFSCCCCGAGKTKGRRGRANPLYSVFLLLEQQQENQRPKGKSQPFGYGGAGKTKGCCKGSSSRANPLGMALLVFLLLCSSSRANPLGMALLVFPCSAAGKTKGCCKGSSSRANPLGMALLVFPCSGENQRPKAAVAEPTLWVWLCYQRQQPLVFPAPQQQQENGMALLVFPLLRSSSRKTKTKGKGKTWIIRGKKIRVE
jgi:hypothetical protein